MANPGAANPQTSPYIGDTTIEITEILAHCSDGSIIPGDDWIEVLNNGTQSIDLSAWRMISSDGELMHMRPSWQWNDTSMVIMPGDRYVFTVPNWFISGLGDSVTLEDPDGNVVDFVEWNITTDCKTMNRDGAVLPWPTPVKMSQIPRTSLVLMTSFSVDSCLKKRVKPLMMNSLKLVTQAT